MSASLQSRHEEIERLPPLREVIAAHKLSAQKALGQNFLLDINITDKIVREASMRNGAWDEAHVFEIGPGPGGLTRSLLKSSAKSVTAIELDRRSIAALEDLKNAAQGDLNIVEGDALDIDLTALSDAPRAIVANLPYNIATPLLMKWLKETRSDRESYSSMTLMFQKEVADRITAEPGQKAFGRLAVMAQWLCDVVQVYDLPPSAFTPPPKVKSAVVHFIPRALDEDAPSFEAVERVTASAFQQRRKMIRSSLKDYLPAIEALRLDPQKRAENLHIQDFLSIAKF